MRSRELVLRVALLDWRDTARSGSALLDARNLRMPASLDILAVASRLRTAEVESAGSEPLRPKPRRLCCEALAGIDPAVFCASNQLCRVRSTICSLGVSALALLGVSPCASVRLGPLVSTLAMMSITRSDAPVAIVKLLSAGRRVMVLALAYTEPRVKIWLDAARRRKLGLRESLRGDSRFASPVVCARSRTNDSDRRVSAGRRLATG